jgi:uncharacterized repeat protein (TIGR04138 family)
MSERPSSLLELALRDSRYAPEAYEFLQHALAYTQRMLGKEPPSAESIDPTNQAYHVSGTDLLEGVRRFALDQFGMMAAVVFQVWGIRSTRDFGLMVFNLVDAGLWCKTELDRIEQFDEVYDFEDAFVRSFRIEWDEI